MLARLEITLDNPDKVRLNHNISSLFQGAIIELINPNYAEILHKDGLKPYSQHIKFDNKGIKWIINTLNQEAYENIIRPLLDVENITLKHKDLTLRINNKSETTKSYDNLINEKYDSKNKCFIKVRFETPTAFKSKGKYVFYPDLRLIFQSLINKFNDVSLLYKIQDENLLEKLIDNSHIVNYKLKSTKFYLERVRINSFVGEITIKVNGKQELINVANLLFTYGEYSGIGIKNALGMGGINLS